MMHVGRFDNIRPYCARMTTFRQWTCWPFSTTTSFDLQHVWLLLHPKLGVVDVISSQPEAFSYPVPHVVALHFTKQVLVVVVESSAQYDKPPVPTHLYPTRQMGC